MANGPTRSAFRERVSKRWSWERRYKEDQVEDPALQGPGSWGDSGRACCLPKGSELLPGPPKPLSVAELSQDSTALSTLGTAGENRAASSPTLSASGGSSSTSLGSLKLLDLWGWSGPGRKSGEVSLPLASDLGGTEMLSKPQFPYLSLVWEFTGAECPKPAAGQSDTWEAPGE